MTTRVGLIAYGLDRSPGGIGRYTRELRRALKDAGWPITTLQAGWSTSDADTVGLAGAGRLPVLLTLGQAEIAWAAKRRGLQLVHDPTGTGPLALTRLPRVITIHDAIPYVYPRTSTALNRIIHRFWLPTIARRVDAVITVSAHAKSELVKHLRLDPESVTVVPEGVGPAFRPLPQAQIESVLSRHEIQPPYLLYVGAIEARKNLARLLEAFALLLPEAPDLTLVVAGAFKWKYGPVFETLQRLQLERKVRMTGYVDEADLPALLCGAKAFAFPSLHEGFGLPVLEAMACGTPVVTSATSALPELAGDAALLVDPLDVGSIARALHRIIDDDELREKLHGRGMQRARSFSWARTASATIRVYERVLATPFRQPVTIDHEL